MKRFRITTWVVSLVLALGVSSVAGTIASSAGAATLAHAAKAQANSAKKHKKHPKSSCPKGTKKHGKVCIKTKVVIHTEPGLVNTALAEQEKKAKEAAEKKAIEAEKKAAEEKAGKEAEALGKNAAEKTAAEQKAGKEAEAAKLKAIEEANAAAAKKAQEEKEEKEKKEKAAHPELGVGPTEAGGTKAIENGNEIPLAPAFTAEQLNAEPSGNWISSEGGTTGDHFSRLSEVTTANAGQLKADWMTELNGSADAPASTPVRQTPPSTTACSTTRPEPMTSLPSQPRAERSCGSTKANFPKRSRMCAAAGTTAACRSAKARCSQPC